MDATEALLLISAMALPIVFFCLEKWVVPVCFLSIFMVIIAILHRIFVNGGF